MLLIGITYIRLETTEERYREKRLETARQVTKLLFYPFDVQSPLPIILNFENMSRPSCSKNGPDIFVRVFLGPG